MSPTRTAARTLTTTEAAVLALLAIEGEQSGYDLHRRVSRSIGHVWAPAKSRLYAVLPRLAADGLAHGRHVRQSGRPDKQLYAITDAGRIAVQRWLATVEPGAPADTVHLKLFVGGLTTHDVLRRHLEQLLEDLHERLAELEELERSNTGRGNDRYHRYLLELGLRSTRESISWAEEVLADL
jgi:PadR family transcriptional regulator, regulatory protein AphA